MEKITPEVRKEAKKLLKNEKIQEFFELFFANVDICHFSNVGMVLKWKHGLMAV